MGLLNDIQPIITIISSLISIGILGFILKLSNQIKELYQQRIEAIKDKASVTEERLKFAEEKLNKMDNMHDDITKIGANLGIEDFVNKLPPGVSIGGGIGDYFSGKIAGRDINDFLTQIGKQIDNSENSIQEYIDKSTKVISSEQINPKAYKYTIDFLFARGHEKIQKDFSYMVSRYANNGWIFHGISSDYNGTDGCLLVFKKYTGNRNREDSLRKGYKH